LALPRQTVDRNARHGRIQVFYPAQQHDIFQTICLLFSIQLKAIGMGLLAYEQ
jgi:hypothetical protein